MKTKQIRISRYNRIKKNKIKWSETDDEEEGKRIEFYDHGEENLLFTKLSHLVP